MQPKDLARIACRTLAIYATVMSLSILSSQLPMFAYLSAGWPAGPALLCSVPYLVLIACAVLLWCKAGAVARWMVAGVGPEQGAEQPDQKAGELRCEIERAAFVAIGIYLVVTTVPELAAEVVDSFMPFEYGGVLSPTKFFTTVAQLVLGLGLIFGAGVLTRLIPPAVSWLRTVGRRPTQEEADE